MAEQNQSSLGLENASEVENVNEFKFEPIKGYPMLNWRGKRPFTSTQYYPAQLKEVYGDEVDGWRNKIYWGDNLQVMSHLLKEFRGKVDLVYIDPPFDSKADYKKKISIRGAKANSSSNSFEEKQYSDLWSNDEYLQFIYERLVLCRELLKSSGSIYLHADWHKCHQLRCIMDEVFSEQNFLNEIVWCYRGMAVSETHFVRRHDNIFLYKKNGDNTFNWEEIAEPFEESTIKKYKFQDEKGRKFRLHGRNIGGSPIQNHTDIDIKWLQTNPELCMVDYLDQKAGSKPRDWFVMDYLNVMSDERVDYPTQKPLQLLDKLIKASSNEGDIVFDCFMGSGTTLASALKNGRRFIGADINMGAVQTTTKRITSIIESDDNFKFKKMFTGLEVFNVNNYDLFRNPVEAKELIIDALEIQRLTFNSIFDGEKDGRMVKVMPVNRICTKADIGELISGFDYKAWQVRQNDKPNQLVEKILLVCMGHEPRLKAELELSVKPFKIDVEVLDILRDKSNLEFKRDSEAVVVTKNGELVIERFYPMNLLQKLSLQKETVTDWREMVESIMIDWNYDGAVLQPSAVDIPDKNEMVAGKYQIPLDAGTIRVKITDVLSESWEGEVNG